MASEQAALLEQAPRETEKRFREEEGENASHSKKEHVFHATLLDMSEGQHDQGKAEELPKKKTHAEPPAKATDDGRCMPESFHRQLGEYEVPDEAGDIEEIVMGHLEFEDLDEARKQALFNAVRWLVGKVHGGMSQKEVEGLYRKASHMQHVNEVARKSELIAAYRRLVRSGEIAANDVFETLLVKKKGKSHSGVLVVTLLMGPSEFSCPKDCHYCPNQPGIARSYLLREPSVLRGYRNGWDPIRQFYDRASALENNGHVVDKIEIIILGGTFSFYPKEYQRDFIAGTFYAANTFYASAPLRPMKSLEEEIVENETTKCRIIGVTVETRPDYITLPELKRFREMGVTRVQLGIQHLDDNILNYINRDCPTQCTIVAIRNLLDAGFKVDAHWMPDLPGSSFEKDMEMFKFLFSKENVDFQVDQWKVYPTATVPYTKIEEWYNIGIYKPYAERDGGALMIQLLIYILENCPFKIRLNRIIRDIPSDYIMGGEKRVNLRQVVDNEMKRRQIRCRDIRERECKGESIVKDDSATFIDEFRASGGTEFYISVENKQRTSLYGHLRLRLRDDPSRGLFPALEGCALIRELHTYGKLVAVSHSNTGKETQHVGVGRSLMRKAEEVALQHGFRRAAIIAGVGVRKYYEKLGYKLMDTYMVRGLAEETELVAASAAAELPPPLAAAAAPEVEEQKPTKGIFSKLKAFIWH